MMEKKIKEFIIKIKKNEEHLAPLFIYQKLQIEFHHYDPLGMILL